MTNKPEHQFLGEILLTPTPSTRNLPNRAIDAHETSAATVGTDSTMLDHVSNPAAHVAYPAMDNVISYSVANATTTICGVVTNVEYEGDSIYSATVSQISNPPIIGESVFTKNDVGVGAQLLSDKHHDIVETRNTIDNTHGFRDLLSLAYFNLERNAHLAQHAWVGMGDNDAPTCVNGTVYNMCLNEDSNGLYTPDTDGWVTRQERDLAIRHNSMWTLFYKYNEQCDTCFKRAWSLPVLVAAVIKDVDDATN